MLLSGDKWREKLVQWSKRGGEAVLLLCFILALSACGGLQSAPEVEAALTPQAGSPIRVSTSADRSKAQSLKGRTLSGEVYIFVRVKGDIKKVQFFIDGTYVKREKYAPYDLQGGSREAANAFDMATLSGGQHKMKVKVFYKSGKRATYRAQFKVSSKPAPPAVTPPRDDPSNAGRWQPEPGLTWQWQLQGALDTSFDVDVYDVDLFDTSARTIRELQRDGRRVICYFSAGSYEPWRKDARAFPKVVRAKKMDGWNEHWLDIRYLEQIAPIMKARLDLAAEKGCDAVEPDNVDAYSNDTGRPISYGDQLRYNKFLAREAHARGLSIGLKNDLEQIKDLEPFFDFAVNEECYQWNECDMLTPFIRANKAVFGAEYEASLSEFCPVAKRLNLSIIKKSYDLGRYREACR